MDGKRLKLYVYAGVTVTLCILITHLEYGQFQLKTVVYPTALLAFGVIVLWMLQRKGYHGMRVKLMIAFGVFILLTGRLLSEMSFCKMNDYHTSHISKNQNSTITFRWIYCGSLQFRKYYYRSPLIGNLSWTREISYSSIDTLQWQRLSNDQIATP